MYKLLNFRLGAMFFVAVILLLTTPDKTYGLISAQVISPYLYNFNVSGTVTESASLDESYSPYWWINSGAYMRISNGRGQTNHGALPALDLWRLTYSLNNPIDTDNGYHPQNIFRLTTRSEWQDIRQEAYFVINANNKSSSPNRNASNGLLLFNRYSENGQTLYYTGIRVDGAVVIKKKINGVYHTMAYVGNVYPGVYNQSSNPNLLPLNKWIGLRSEVTNKSDGTVLINLFVDKGWSGQWKLVATAIDDGKKYGPVISQKGLGGIRTDFMDVTFENYRVSSI